MPPQKGKAAKGKAGPVDADEAREALQLLDCGAAPPADTLHKVFRLNVGPCSATCGEKGSRGVKDNPCCFHGMLPAEGSFRKKGLWQKEPVLGQLGYDPADDKRVAPTDPAGLRNLGNTCYVNAAMQFLHSLPAFRNALYKLEPELAEQDIVKQMRDLFIEMHFGPKRYVDPEPFANSLLLDHAIQQDGQEFLKLLLSKLEVVFAGSQQEDVSTVVQSLFQGHLSHVTTCHTCKQPSEGSKREVEFYELSLQVQQMPSLHQSLVAALAPDELVGDNQYFCDYCTAKSDADRRMRLRSLPPYLCLALQRFTYDQQTWEKKKVLHKLSIPLQLDMGQVLLDAGLPLPEAAPMGHDRQLLLPGSSNSTYELAAVLIHKGTSASHGHYVAHIKLHDTGTWWRFDDEEAVEMGLQPTSHPQDHGTTAAAAAGATGAAAAAAGTASADDSSKPSTGRKRGRGGAAAGSNKRGRGGGRGSSKKGKKGSKQEPWEEDSDADADAEAATAAAEEADEGADMAAALQMSLLEAQGNGHVEMSQAELQATVEAAELAVEQAQGSRARRKAAGASAASRGRGRGGRGRGKGKGAAAGAAAEDAAAAAPADAAAAVAAANGPASTVPRPVVEQIMSANAYFLVYRQCPPDAAQLAAAAATAPAAATGQATAAHAEAPAELPLAAAAAPAEVVKQEQSSGQDDNQKKALQPRDQNSEPATEHAPTPAVVKQQPAADKPVQPQQQHQQQPHPEQNGATAEQQLPLAAQQLQAQLQALPEAVQQQVQRLHREFDEASGRFQQRKQEALAGISHRQQEVSSIAELLPVPEGSESQGCFICQKWLDTWVNSAAEPDPVDNSVLLCQHQKLNPLLPTGTLKFINDNAWQQLTARHRGGPRLSCSDVCVECLGGLMQGLVSSQDLSGMRDELLAALDAAEASQNDLVDAPSSYYVSKTWVGGFKRRTGGTKSTLEPPTAGVACQHGRLAPEGRSGSARRFAVPPKTWALLSQYWPRQVLLDIQARKDKAARAATAKRAAGGGLDAAAVADAAKDDEAVIILDSPQKDKHQHQQQPTPDQPGDGGSGPQVDDDGDVTMIDVDDQQQQQQQQQQDAGLTARSSPGAADTGDAVAGEAAAAAAASSWQPPFPLDGSVPLSEVQLRECLPEFQVAAAYVCEECAASLQEAAAGHQEVKQQLEGQKTELGKLLAGSVTEALEQGVPYYLVPNSWLDTWRRHLHAALAKKLVVPAALPPAPEPLPQAIRALMCKCHPPEQPLLAVPLPDVVNKRGRFSQADAQKDALRVVTAVEWQHLLLHNSGLDADVDADAAAAAAVGSREQQQQQQQPPAAVSAGPSRRRSGRQQQQQQQREPGLQPQTQEEQDILRSRIASLAESDAGFRGIKAWLKVAGPTLQQEEQQQQQEQLKQQDEQQQRQPEGQAAIQSIAQEGLQQPQQQQELKTAAVPVVAAGGASGGSGGAEEAVDLTADSSGGAQRRSKRQRQVLDLSCSPTAPPPADADVVMVDSVDLAAGEPPQLTAAAATAAEAAAPAAAVAAGNGAADANGDCDDVTVSQVIDADPANLPAGAAVQHQGQPDAAAGRSSKRTRQPSRRQPTVAEAAARLRRPVRSAAAGAAAAVAAEAASTPADSAELDGGSDSEAAAVAAGAAAAAAMRGWLVTEPGMCEPTLQADAAARRAATLVYTDAELMVELVTEEELQAASAIAGTGERRSRRARKNRQPIKACSTDTLAMLRLKVFEALAVHPQNQRLYVRGELLQGEDFTLAKLEVFPEEEIRLVNANQVPDDDYASVFDGVAGRRKAREVETGFKDTALHGSMPPAAATPATQDSNPAGAELGQSNPDNAAQQQEQVQPQLEQAQHEQQQGQAQE